MNDYDKTKFCPFIALDRRYPPDPAFAPCLQDKCAMWRLYLGTFAYDANNKVSGTTPDVWYCGLGGKP